MNEKNGRSFGSVVIAIVITSCLTFAVTSMYYWKKMADDSVGAYDGSSYAKLDRVKKIIKDNFLFEYDEEKFIDGAINGIIDTLDDPYTEYYNEEEWENFMTSTEGKYEGVGIYITYDKTNSTVIVLTPIEGSPAAEAGIMPGDYIVSVDGKNVVGKTLNEVTDLLKGKIGTKVSVEFERINDDGKTERFTKELSRENIVIEPVIEKVLEDNIGYIKLTSFDEITYSAFKEAYEDLIDNKKVKGLILDVRNNPGGLLDVSTNIADMLVPEGKIVYTVDKNGKEETIYSDKKQIEIPLVVLINEGSASASEVLTAAVKDYGVGTIIGTKSYGKGIVQGIRSLRDGTYMKITISEYFSPNGNQIHKLGVAPDIEVELPDDIKSTYKLELKDDTQLQRAIEEIKKKTVKQ